MSLIKLFSFSTLSISKTGVYMPLEGVDAAAAVLTEASKELLSPAELNKLAAIGRSGGVDDRLTRAEEATCIELLGKIRANALRRLTKRAAELQQERLELDATAASLYAEQRQIVRAMELIDKAAKAAA